MHAPQVIRLIECLESARTRPEMYFRDIDVDAAMHFLNGMNLALFACFGDHRDVRNQVLVARGWPEEFAMHSSRHMVERGLTPAEVIDELLVVEIETLRQLAAKSG